MNSVERVPTARTFACVAGGLPDAGQTTRTGRLAMTHIAPGHKSTIARVPALIRMGIKVCHLRLSP
jgi:hypothetical protein